MIVQALRRRGALSRDRPVALVTPVRASLRTPHGGDADGTAARLWPVDDTSPGHRRAGDATTAPEPLAHRLRTVLDQVALIIAGHRSKPTCPEHPADVRGRDRIADGLINLAGLVGPPCSAPNLHSAASANHLLHCSTAASKTSPRSESVAAKPGRREPPRPATAQATSPGARTWPRGCSMPEIA